KVTFALFLSGSILLCCGFLLLVFTVQTCPSETSSDCSGTVRASGPVLIVTGFICLLVARSRTSLQVDGRLSQNDQVHNFLLCQGRCRSAQFLIFGFLFLTSGMLVSILGIWIPSCSSGWPTVQLNRSSSSDGDHQGCVFLSFQVMGPLIVLTGLSFIVIAHIKKKQNFKRTEESLENEECSQSPESVPVTVGDATMMFPPPPPPYFADPRSQTVAQFVTSGDPPTSKNLPPSTVLSGIVQPADNKSTIAVRDYESMYTISMSSSPFVSVPMQFLSSESPPECEEAASAAAKELSPYS
ncbi:TM171 protein, partial [Alectura lathami]|nr:TM171 protein [Alectura lathami]